MAIMIWIQTGLALVIFSAALRSIPSETLDAARIDGASELKIFWSIIIPLSPANNSGYLDYYYNFSIESF